MIVRFSVGDLKKIRIHSLQMTVEPETQALPAQQPAIYTYEEYAMRKVLVLGASGATGRLLVQQLLRKDINVTAIVRSTNALPDELGTHPKLKKVVASISMMPENELATHLHECDAVALCLGHNLTFKGIFGSPRRLVTEAVSKVCKAISSLNNNKKLKLVLMNSTGCSNRDIPEKPPLSQRFVISILRLLLPPHTDNENASDFLRLNIGKNSNVIEWVTVRPDSLTDETEVTEYDIYPSPIRNAIFNSGASSRINVADFMANLVLTDELWDEWKGKMPVVYNHA